MRRLQEGADHHPRRPALTLYSGPPSSDPLLVLQQAGDQIPTGKSSTILQGSQATSSGSPSGACCQRATHSQTPNFPVLLHGVCFSAC